MRRNRLWTLMCILFTIWVHHFAWGEEPLLQARLVSESLLPSGARSAVLEVHLQGPEEAVASLEKNFSYTVNILVEDRQGAITQVRFIQRQFQQSGGALRDSFRIALELRPEERRIRLVPIGLPFYLKPLEVVVNAGRQRQQRSAGGMERPGARYVAPGKENNRQPDGK